MALLDDLLGWAIVAGIFILMFEKFWEGFRPAWEEKWKPKIDNLLAKFEREPKKEAPPQEEPEPPPQRTGIVSWR